jgi:hypothetical protein
MALPVSSLSQICRSIADFVGVGLDAIDNSIRIMIGTPADAAPKDSDTDHRVNLFFYRLEPSGFFPDTFPGEPWRLRLHCLITAFGVSEELISSGENDLRLLGEVVRIFHENPVLETVDVDGEQVRLQVVFQPLSADDINHLWSTQGDVAYRTSVAYEMALAPIVPEQTHIPSPLVASTGYQSHGTIEGRWSSFGGVIQSPPVAKASVDTGPADWAPRICFVYQDACAQSLAFEIGSQALTDFTPSIWVAGDTDETVTLTWERWTSEDGWTFAGEQNNVAITDATIDPDRAADVATTSFALPAKDEPGQAVLYAVRSYTLAGEEIPRSVRSNPLLVTLYASAS